MITLGKNILAQGVLGRLSQNSSALESSYERLSSGQRINHASDDAAGLAIAEGLQLTTRIHTQGIKNVNDGVSALSIAQDALQNLTSISVRLEELTTQAANGTYGYTQRKAMHGEAEALVNEFNRIVQSTSFNRVSLLQTPSQSLQIQAGQGSGTTLQTTLNTGLAADVGTGAFSANSSTPSINAGYLASGDFDGNGVLDLVVGDYGGTSLVFAKNNGSGSFSAASTYTFTGGQSILKIQAADFNQDGSRRRTHA